MAAPTTAFASGSGTISATGESNGLLLTVNTKVQNPRVRFGFSGTFTSVVVAIRGRLNGLTAYYPVRAVNPGTSTVIADSTNISLTDSTNQAVEVDASGCDSLEVYVVSGTPTAFTVEERTFAASSPLLNVVNSSVSGAQAFGGNVSSTGSILSSSATAGVGYATGAGGAVTQATSRTTGVTLNKTTGAITLVSAAGSATPATFTVTNSAVAATDVVLVSQKSGTDLYEIFVTNVAAGSFKITSFTTGGTTTEQPVFNFVVVKGVAA